jgi:hypothetical protein
MAAMISSARGIAPGVYRQLKRGRSGDEVRPGIAPITEIEGPTALAALKSTIARWQPFEKMLQIVLEPRNGFGRDGRRSIEMAVKRGAIVWKVK